jgi:putative transposase
MARIARVVAPAYAHHVTQRGNRRQPTFFGDENHAAYREENSRVFPDSPKETDYGDTN